MKKSWPWSPSLMIVSPCLNHCSVKASAMRLRSCRSSWLRISTFSRKFWKRYLFLCTASLMMQLKVSRSSDQSLACSESTVMVAALGAL